MRQNKMTKIVAFIALFSIILYVVWTWILVIYEMYFLKNNNDSLTQEQLEEIIRSYSWDILSWEILEENSSWIIDNSNSWIILNIDDSSLENSFFEDKNNNEN